MLSLLSPYSHQYLTNVEEQLIQLTVVKASSNKINLQKYLLI